MQYFNEIQMTLTALILCVYLVFDMFLIMNC